MEVIWLREGSMTPFLYSKIELWKLCGSILSQVYEVNHGIWNSFSNFFVPDAKSNLYLHRYHSFKIIPSWSAHLHDDSCSIAWCPFHFRLDLLTITLFILALIWTVHLKIIALLNTERWTCESLHCPVLLQRLSGDAHVKMRCVKWSHARMAELRPFHKTFFHSSFKQLFNCIRSAR